MEDMPVHSPRHHVCAGWTLMELLVATTTLDDLLNDGGQDRLLIHK